MATKLARMVIDLDRLLIIKSCKALIMWSCYINLYISITRVSVATKLGRMIASVDKLLPIMSPDPLITWPCEIRGSLTEGGLARKRLSRHRLLVTFYSKYKIDQIKWFIHTPQPISLSGCLANGISDRAGSVFVLA